MPVLPRTRSLEDGTSLVIPSRSHGHHAARRAGSCRRRQRQRGRQLHPPPTSSSPPPTCGRNACHASTSARACANQARPDQAKAHLHLHFSRPAVQAPKARLPCRGFHRGAGRRGRWSGGCGPQGDECTTEVEARGPASLAKCSIGAFEKVSTGVIEGGSTGALEKASTGTPEKASTGAIYNGHDGPPSAS